MSVAGIATNPMALIFILLFQKFQIPPAKSGEHRLPACSFRQLAEKTFEHSKSNAFAALSCCRQAADDCRLAACAPQDADCANKVFDLRDHVVSRHLPFSKLEFAIYLGFGTWNLEPAAAT